MKHTEVLQAWTRILGGRLPAMSIEITRECPLRCPGCYAYEDGHLGGEVTLRQLVDHGCIASMALSAVGHHELVPGITAGDIFHISAQIGKMVSRLRFGTT